MLFVHRRRRRRRRHHFHLITWLVILAIAVFFGYRFVPPVHNFLQPRYTRMKNTDHRLKSINHNNDNLNHYITRLEKPLHHDRHDRILYYPDAQRILRRSENSLPMKDEQRITQKLKNIYYSNAPAQQKRQQLRNIAR